MNHKDLICPIALALLVLMTGARADAYTVSVPEYEVNPSAPLVVPISLDNVAGLAQIRIQLNYDSQVLQLDGISAGLIGEQFDMSHEIVDGSITIDFVRTAPLAGSGGGQLAKLSFTANAGATVDLYSDLALAEFEIGDASGVRDLTLGNDVNVINGSVRVSLDSNIDNASNGIPDWWEIQHDLDLFADITGEDLDGDSLVRLLEYAFGGNPHASDANVAAPTLSVESVGGDSYAVLTWRRRTALASLNYLLEDSCDLLHWTTGDLNARLLAVPVDLGDGLERIRVRGRFPLGDPDTDQRDFMRISIETQAP